VVTKRNLVLGAIRGYQFKDLAPFVKSLRQTSFDGDVVFLWNSVDEETRRQLEEHGVKLVYFAYRGGALNSWSRFWPWVKTFVSLPIGNYARNAIYRKILNLAFVRYIHAMDFLQRNAGSYDKVLLTDARDVVFQADPFRDELPGEVVAFLESPQMTYGAEPMNDGWIVENYNQRMLEQLRSQRISCCGTVAGSLPGMLNYLEKFRNEIARLKSVAHGADTSIHNVLIRRSSSDLFSIAENYESMVGTVGPAFDEVMIGKDDLVYESSGRTVPVLHQYDRHECLRSFWHNRFGIQQQH
jgi:hypothetical protein